MGDLEKWYYTFRSQIMMQMVILSRNKQIYLSVKW